MDDIVTVALVLSSAFFVSISSGLLLRYREVSNKINSSNDLGLDLWQTLETRLKKQDERVLDIMGRLEVVQSRVAMKAASPDIGLVGTVRKGGSGRSRSTVEANARDVEVVGEHPPPAQAGGPHTEVASGETTTDAAGDLIQTLLTRLNQQDNRILELLNRIESVQSQIGGGHNAKSSPSPRERSGSLSLVSTSESTDRTLLGLLAQRPRTSVEIREEFGISREHSARLLKALFDRGMVVRNASKKPFVYELTDSGRRGLSAR